MNRYGFWLNRTWNAYCFVITKWKKKQMSFYAKLETFPFPSNTQTKSYHSEDKILSNFSNNNQIFCMKQTHTHVRCKIGDRCKCRVLFVYPSIVMWHNEFDQERNLCSVLQFNRETYFFLLMTFSSTNFSSKWLSYRCDCIIVRFNTLKWRSEMDCI